MKQVFILFLFSLALPTMAFAIDVGDGSDGTCDVSGAANTQITAARKYYQCTTLDIDQNLGVFAGGQAGSGGAALVIKVQGNATVAVGVTINLSGANGIAGDNGAKSGGSAGAGGGAGGNSIVGGNGQNGNGSGAGTFGVYVADDPGGTSSYGGGGGGGSFKTKSVTEPNDGFDGNVGGAGTKGANGNNFLVSESQFDTIFSGGSGGAAGGGGTIAGVPVSGSSGAGSGGAIRIISGGNILVDGSIITNGGIGGGVGATSSSGPGGGASGGAVWLQAAGTLTISGTSTITTNGGVGGTHDFGSVGGNGGNGAIRLDDADGAIVNTGTLSQAPFSTSFTPTAITSGSSAISRAYSSSVGCAKVALPEENSIQFLMNLIIGLLISTMGYLSISKKAKW